MQDGLQIRKGGKLVKNEYQYDELTKSRSYVETDITPNAISHLFDQCDLEEGVTLRDIFLLVNTELQLFDAVLNNWVKEIVAEGLSGQADNKTKREQEIEYLELKQHIFKDLEHKTNTLISYGYNNLDFGGVGPVLAKDEVDTYGNIIGKAGEQVNWGIGFTPTYDLIDLPVKLNKEVQLFDEKSYMNPPTSLGKVEFTLGVILHSIFYELSFYGAPASRDKVHEEIMDAASNIQDTISHADIKELFDK